MHIIPLKVHSMSYFIVLEFNFCKYCPIQRPSVVMENINCSEHNCTESHVCSIFLFSMETRRHFAIYQQVCCQIRTEGLLPAHCACQGMAQLSLMHRRNSCTFPTVPLKLQQLAEYWAVCYTVTFQEGRLKVFCFQCGNDKHALAVWRNQLSDTLQYVKGIALTQKELCTCLLPISAMFTHFLLFK